MLKGLGCFKFSSSGFCVVALCRGKEDGKDFYTYLAIEPHNYRHFVQSEAAKTGMNLTNYGHVLLRGWGAEPNINARNYLSKKYGIEFGLSENFLASLVESLAPAAAPLGRDYFNRAAENNQGQAIALA